ncbi:hypothetical protein AYO44_09925 [Planctomycetaceae bacterium SCGC AG-212-F19]|nr:hypothetical protein AYO44_09925 [Planctomycetaceae bacterium SCGC AG-212-F19]
MHLPLRLRLLPALLLGLLAGCTGGSTPPGTAAETDKVKAAFESVQQAIKARDADKLWNLLDSDTQADAERAAKAWKEKYAMADAEKVKKDLGISTDELAKLAGASFLKTEPFHNKYEELSQSKMKDVKVTGDQAAVDYVEPDGDKETLKLARQNGQWKARLMMPMPKS